MTFLVVWLCVVCGWVISAVPFLVGDGITLAAGGLEELFFQLCCCVNFLVVVGNSFRCYLPAIPVVPSFFFCCGGKYF